MEKEKSVKHNQEQATGWEKVAEAGKQAPEATEDFVDRQPEQRQHQMKAEWARLELCKMDVAAAERENDEAKLGRAQSDLIWERDRIIERHLEEPDMMECLAEIMGVKVNGLDEVISAVRRKHPEKVFEHFDEMVGMCERSGKEHRKAVAETAGMIVSAMDRADELMVKGERYAREQHGAENRYRSKAWEYERVLQILDANGVEPSIAAIQGFVGASCDTEEDCWKMVEQLDFLQQKMPTLDYVADQMIERGRVDVLYACRENLEERGVDVWDNLEMTIMEDLRKGEVGHVAKCPEGFELFGLDAGAFCREVIARGYTASVRANIEVLQEIGVEITAEELDALDEVQRQGDMPEFRGQYVTAADLPKEARSEQRQMMSGVEMVRAERQVEYFAAMEKFLPDNWGELGEEERIKAVSRLSRELAVEYNLVAPYVIEIASSDEYGGHGSSTYGNQSQRWFKKDDPKAESFVQALETEGIDLPWVQGARITINQKIMDDGAEVVDTIAHEFWHAAQAQQAFLYRSGCYEKEEHAGHFYVVPHLAKYYAANFQGGTYVPSERDWEDYRYQLIEDEAFQMGEKAMVFLSGMEATMKAQAAREEEKKGKGIRGIWKKSKRT